MPLDKETLGDLIVTMRRYVQEGLLPNEARVDEEDRVPPEILEEMRRLGFFGLLTCMVCAMAGFRLGLLRGHDRLDSHRGEHGGALELDGFFLHPLHRGLRAFRSLHAGIPGE